MADYSFSNIFQGKRIKITLKSSFCVGVVQRISSSKTVTLTNVVFVDNGRELPGSRLIFGHEFVNVEFTDDEDKKHGNIPEDHLKLSEFQPFKTFYHADDDDDEYVKFEVINAFHEKFGPAIMQIKKQHVVGVGADGVDMYKHGRLCWLQIATKHKVYLFDILLLGEKAFKNGLTMILESKGILKVVHDCRAIAGCLMTQHGVKMTNVFDTQVADVMCFHSETGGFFPHKVSTLHELVSRHLKLPSSHLSVLETKSQFTEEESKLWYKRPCPLPLLNAMALSVIHLQPLRMALLDCLLTDYVALVDVYLSNSQYPNEDLESINMEKVFDLPAELRLLDQMHCERRECAAKRYPTTDKGLLIRSGPRTETPLHTSPVSEQHESTEPTVEPQSAPPPMEADENAFPAFVDVATPDPVPDTTSEEVSEMSFGGGVKDLASLLMEVMA
ncbi:piRNA biogenesis protein EXD1 [Syngnathus typhle]|uniref:piRNA biogenesis protein EXD1 n=1 Tax=Syngnathus typhle TaxID=161592 RepID=UPI002A6AD529|nr:piRNA biogenesis protein EXD1 [Syngnathus typhle]